MVSKIYRTSITISSAVIAEDEEAAEEQILATLPTDMTFGEWGQALPFEIEKIVTTQIIDEDIPRS